MDDYLSDDSYETEEYQVDIDDKINIFISNYLDNMIDIYLDFEERFSYTPAFLEYAKENSTILVGFIIDYLFKNTSIQTNKDTSKFERLYKNEINNSYNIIKNFTKHAYGKVINLNDWIQFCYCMSNTNVSF
jgi:hypothetical protein